MVTGSLAIRRGASVDMCFSTLRVNPAKSKPIERALMPMIVAMQLISAAAQRSVGEKDSPLPWLSKGASVVKVTPEGECVEVVRKSPS